MRRPSRFSSAVPAETPPAPVAAPAAASPLPRSTSRWQQDPSFGVWLLLFLLLFNLGLAGVFSLLTPSNPKPISIRAGTTDTAHDSATSAPVVMYRDSAGSTSASQGFDLNRVPPEQNALSVSPNAMPVPKARAMSADE
jgi:zona occludens toxin (predicted ATPase)